VVTPTVVFDSEALSSVARQDRAALLTLSAAKANRQRVVVPTAVLAEVFTGKQSDAAVWHVLSRVLTCDLTTSIAARAGALRRQASKVRAKRRDMTIDAIVVATAEELAPAVIVTGDPDDMTMLVTNQQVRVTCL